MFDIYFSFLCMGVGTAPCCQNTLVSGCEGQSFEGHLETLICGRVFQRCYLNGFGSETLLVLLLQD